MKYDMTGDDEGVNMVTEYIMVFIMAMFVFTFLISSSQWIFVDGPSKIVSRNQFMDIGNDVDAKLIDTYLVAPRNGTISTTFDIPADVAGHGYVVQISDAPNQDKEVYVYSDHYKEISVKLTLNGVNSTIPIIGNTSSHNAVHTISYKSND
jgi:hypothetical protein